MKGQEHVQRYCSIKEQPRDDNNVLEALPKIL